MLGSMWRFGDLADSQKGFIRDDYEICEFLKEGTKFRMPGFCNKIAICKNGKTELSTTCANAVDLSKMACGKATDSYCKLTCTKKSLRFNLDPKNCGDGYHFDETLQKCNYKSAVPCEASFEFCDVLQTKTNFVDFNNCHKYFQCTSTQKYDSQFCPEGNYFDIKSGSCIRKSQAQCYKHPVPDEVCGTTKIPIRNKFVKDRATCRGYFFCKDTGSYTTDVSPTWGQCGVGLFFSEDRQACIPPKETTCDEDRCDGVESGTTLSQRIGCQHYLVCSQGSEMEERKCPDNEYYDAALNECTPVKQSYPACS